MAAKIMQVYRGRPNELAFRSLIRTLGLLKRVMEPHFARFGISGSQWGVLRTLHRAQEEEGLVDLRLTDLGDRLLIRPASVSGAVDRLQRLGLLARAASSTDQRAKNVSLTDAGRELVQRVLECHAEQIEAVLEALSESEQEDLHRLLDRLGIHLEAMADGRLGRREINQRAISIGGGL
jgi:DNA-binding MarR family transcriptional regulator